jgi:hypothetical protein
MASHAPVPVIAAPPESRDGVGSVPSTTHARRWSVRAYRIIGMQACALACAIVVGYAPTSLADHLGDDAHVVIDRGAAISFRDAVCQYFVSRSPFEALQDALGLSAAQRNACWSFYEEYTSAVETLYHETLQQLMDGPLGELYRAAGPMRDESAFDRIGRERAASLLREYVRHVRRAQMRADRLRAELEERVKSILGDHQFEMLPAAERSLRRDLLLRPDNPGGMHYDLDVLPDVITLYWDAVNNGELEALRYESGEQQELLAEARRRIAEVLEAYEYEMDGRLLSDVRRRADLKAKHFIAIVLMDMSDAERAQKHSARIWRAKYHLTERTVEAIADVVEQTLGASARRAWMTRYYRIVFPELLGPETTDVLVEWLHTQSLDLEVLVGVEEVYESYLINRGPLRSAARRIMVKLRTSQPHMFGRTGISSLEVDIPEALQDIEARRAEHARTTNENLRNLVGTEIRELFDRELQQILDRRYHSIFGLVRY